MRRPGDIDLYLARCFLRVAELQHFGWAADELHIAQPTLSRYVQRLERQIGAVLLDRGPSGTRLTPAGETLQRRLTRLLDEVGDVVSLVRASTSICLGYVGDLFVTAAAVEMRRRHPALDVETIPLAPTDVNSALRRRKVDLVVARLPFDIDGLHIAHLRKERRVLLVPLGHPLAGRGEVRWRDFAEAPLVRYAEPDYDAFWRVDPRPDGSRAPEGPLADSWSDKLEAVAAGQALALAPESSRTPRADLLAIPVVDIDPVSVVAASRSGEDDPLVQELLEPEVRRLLAPTPAAGGATA